MSYSFCFLVLGLLFWGCSSTEILTPSEISDKDLPLSVAILPFEGQVDQKEKLPYLRQMFSRYFSNQGFEQLRLDIVDETLKVEKLDRRTSLQQLGEALGVEGIILGNIEAISNVNAAYLGYRSKIEGTIRFYRTRDQKLLWEVRRSEVDYGGVLVYSGQVFEGISSQIDNSSDIGFIRLAEKFCTEILQTAPKRPVLQEPLLPEIEGVQVRSAGGRNTLGVGEELWVECQGTPQRTASFSLGKVANIPMSEVQPGRYQGIYTLKRGDSSELFPVVLRLRDRFNHQKRYEVPSVPFQILAKSPAPPTQLRYEGGRFQWVAQGQNYVVYGRAKGSTRIQKLGTTTSTQLALPPQFETLLVSAVDLSGNQSLVASLNLSTSP
jgi:hypothetical protein